ncbi:MAG: aspartate aminotransferase family protein [Alphaproteobacteria bacterium]|nr:aspartate aminotransferase family protein [Alphaproteobacteria bacterium]
MSRPASEFLHPAAPDIAALWPGHNATARSRSLYERAIKVMPGGSTRAGAYMAPYPPYVARGQGCRVWDVDGNEYLDFANNFFSLVHGHAHPRILDAMTRMARNGLAFGLPTESDVLLAEHLHARSPVLEHIRFMNSGTEAIMQAIKCARAATGRPKIAKVEGAYHGSYDHIEISLDPTPENWGDDLPVSIPFQKGTPPAVAADTVVIPFNDVARTHRAIEAHASKIAAVIVDPLPSRVGMVPATDAYLKALREICTRHGILLVFDEIISFRLGHGGAHRLFGAEPDLVALGKVIGGGLPIGAVAGKAAAMSVFDNRKGKPPLSHSGTFTANPVTMATGLACMELLTPDAYAQLDALGARLRDGANALLLQKGIAGIVTGMGSLFRIHLGKTDVHDYRSQWPSDAQRGQIARLHRFFMASGMLLTPNCSGSLSTPMTEAEIDRFLAVLAEGIDAVA